jgi:hypothetical protein
VGNDNSSYPVCGQIKFTQAGNSSVQDYFDRTELTHTHFDVTYYPEIDGHGSYIENAPTTISLPYTIIPLAAFRIPLHDTTGVEVSYVFQSTVFNQMRNGTISIAIDKVNLGYQLVDDYNYVGTGGQDGRVIFTADIQNNALVVFYTNLNIADNNSFTYTYTITS